MTESRPLTFFLLPLIALHIGCGKSAATTDSPPRRVDISPGGFHVTVDSTSKISISSAGRDLIAGLPSGSVAPDAAPLVGWAVREADRNFEMKVGSFKIDDVPIGPWKVASGVIVEQADPLIARLVDSSDRPLARISITSPSDGHLALLVDNAGGRENRLSWGFACRAEDRFVGFGSQSWDIDQRGQKVPIWTRENGIGKSESDDYDDLIWFVKGRRHSAQWPMPWTLSNRGLALIAENDGYTEFSLCNEQDSAARIELDLPVTFHVFDGPTPAQATTRATSWFGRPRVPPPVAFAPWNDAIHGTQSVMDKAKFLRDHDIPSSVIWTEDWRGGEFSGDAYQLKEEWEVDPTLYPDLSGTISSLNDQGFAFHGYFNQFVYLSSKAYTETSPNGWLIKTRAGDDYLFTGAKFTETSLLDLTHPDANQWAADKMRGLMDLGADGWMHDYAEWLPTDAIMHGGDSIKFHNRYPVLWQQIARSVIDEKNDDRQRTFFVRSGWFGTPQISDVFWAGDQATSFAKDDGLPSVITQGINLSVNGCPAFGHDVSGYQSSLGTPATKELFWRWTAFGAFSPVMRTHHGYQDSLNHNLTTDADTTDMWRRYAIEHIQLAPYLMAHAKKASDETGLALFRGLFLQYPNEDTAWTIRDEYLLGDAILVAPVIEKDALSRKVWFPSETHWFPWSGGAAKVIVSADQTEEIAAPLGEIPVFVRPGTLIPRYPNTIRTLVYSSAGVPGPAEIGDDRDLLVFVGGAYSITEPGDLGYELTLEQGSASVDPIYTWNGAALPACPTTGTPASCVTADTGTGAIAYVTGPGELRVEASGQASVVKITGGKTTRKLSIQVRR